MRSMVEGDARWRKGRATGNVDSRASRSTTLRVVPLSQEGEEELPAPPPRRGRHGLPALRDQLACGISSRMRFVKLLSATSFTLSGPMA